MTITLTPGQERVIEEAIRTGLVRSVDEFIEAAIESLPHHLEHAFDIEKAREAGERIRELRKGVKLDRNGMSFRELAHLGHKY
jgi:Arc/MetJ-type ribon-helix-helix transcriptional regulator